MLELLKNIFTALTGVIVSFVMIFTGSPGKETPVVINKTQEENIVQEVEEGLPSNETTGSADEPPTDETEEPPKEIAKETPPQEKPEEKPQEEAPENTIEEEVVVVESGSGINIMDSIITIPPIQTEIKTSISEVNQKTREALVNILCTSRQGGSFQPITGSGVIIDDRGVILTNAHIAQYYLLRDYIATDFLECTIRTGSPARNAYKAELLFISSLWIKDNYQKIALSNPRGTGEDDFALLLITETTNGDPLPQIFPALSPDMRGIKPKTGDTVVVAGYPAGFLGGIAIQKDLYAISTITKVMDIFTFEKNTLDLFSVGGNIAAQKGSSGGAIASSENRLLGIIVTASEAKQTDDRDLRAISLYHVNESLKKDSGIDLDSYLFGNLLQKSNQFNQVVSPGLTKLLEDALNQ